MMLVQEKVKILLPKQASYGTSNNSPMALSFFDAGPDSQRTQYTLFGSQVWLQAALMNLPLNEHLNKVSQVHVVVV